MGDTPDPREETIPSSEAQSRPVSWTLPWSLNAPLRDNHLSSTTRSMVGMSGRKVARQASRPLALFTLPVHPPHKVQHLHDLLWGSPGLMGRMHVDLKVGHQVPLGHTGYHNE